MRILVVTPWFPTVEASSAGVFVRREVQALAARHDVTVLHLDWQRHTPLNLGDGDYRRVHVALDRANPLSYLRARRLVARAAVNADIVHTHALTGLLPWLAGRPARLPWVHSEHWSGLTSPETLGTAECFTKALLRPILRRPDVVIAESGRLADAIRAGGRAEVAIVPCVVADVTVVPRPATPPLRLVGVGSLIPRKGPLLAVAAVAELVARGRDATLTWVGDGPLRDDVRHAAESAGIGDRVTLTGPLSDSGVGAMIDAAELFVLPTQGDNFCVVAAEALVHGRPIVSGAATGAIDYADPAVSRFVETRTASAYADAIVDLAAATANLLAVDVAATVAGRFTPSAVADALDAAYVDIAGRTAPTPSARLTDWVATHPASLPGRIAALRHGLPRRSDRREVARPGGRPTEVLIAPANYAGQAHRWARALTLADSAMNACALAVQSPYGFTADAVVAPRVFQNSPTWQREQRDAARGFTHLLVESLIPPFGRLAGRDLAAQLRSLGDAISVALVCHGTDVRRSGGSAGRIASRNRALVARLDLPTFVSTPDLIDDVPTGIWLPVVVDVDAWNASPSTPAERLRVAHAPSSAAVKGSALIQPTVDRLVESGEIEYRAVTNVPHAQMPAVIASSDVVLDQFVLGSYGVAACEAMAAGRVVVGHVTDAVRERVHTATGYDVPIVEATPATLEDVLRSLAADPARVAALGTQGHEFVRAVHSGPMSARILRDVWIHPVEEAP